MNVLEQLALIDKYIKERSVDKNYFEVNCNSKLDKAEEKLRYSFDKEFLKKFEFENTITKVQDALSKETEVV